MYSEFAPPKEIILEHPLSDTRFIQNSRKIFTDILNQKDPRFILILGPCSIDDPKAALEYAQNIAELQTLVSSQFFLLMRVYLEKPRTSIGWKGFLNDPDFEGNFDPLEGIKRSRTLLDQITNLKVPIATEFLSPFTAPYYQDFVTWGSIGARTACSITHRQLAASSSMPIGFKNSVEGCMMAAIHGISIANQPQNLLGVDPEGKIALISTEGNPDCHLVLRGGTITGPNFDPTSIQQAIATLKNANLSPRILIDCSHQNSGKDLDTQVNVFKSVMDQKDAETSIFGAMLESYLVRGSQNQPENYGQSLTDPCLSWEETRKLILECSQCYV